MKTYEFKVTITEPGNVDWMKEDLGYAIESEFYPLFNTNSGRMVTVESATDEPAETA